MAIFCDAIAARLATPTELRILNRALRDWRGYQLPNGIPKRRKLRPEMFNPDQLAIGTTVELEHTSNPTLALEIAMAHLSEHPLYYAALEAAERRLRRL